MQRKDALVEGEIYHVFNRGVEKRNIFSDQYDYRRFLNSLFQFNTHEPMEIRRIAPQNSKNASAEVQPPQKEMLVSLLAYTLLPNHYHLLLRQEAENGISEFMQKIGTGYTMYFNQKMERVGPLFQGRFKSVHIGEDAQFLYIPHYVHLNVLDMTHPGWKESGMNVGDALNSIKEYEWSSAREYAGVKVKQSILSRDAIKEIFNEDPLDEKLLGDLIKNPQ